MDFRSSSLISTIRRSRSVGWRSSSIRSKNLSICRFWPATLPEAVEKNELSKACGTPLSVMRENMFCSCCTVEYGKLAPVGAAGVPASVVSAVSTASAAASASGSLADLRVNAGMSSVLNSGAFGSVVIGCPPSSLGLSEGEGTLAIKGDASRIRADAADTPAEPHSWP
jgi:hypothetical protein